MAKPKNGKAKRIYKEQAQAQAVVQEQVKAQQRKSSTRFNRWVLGILAFLFVVCTGFAVSASRAAQVEYNQHRSIDDEDVDPQTWRDLTMVMTTAGGVKNYITLLRPMWWIEKVGAEAGKTINLNLSEMGMEGPTKVISVKRLEDDKIGGAGTVTGTFKHIASNIFNLQLQGEKKPIGVTSTHPFRSADRNAWVPVGELRVGERVETHNGTTKVVSIKKRPGSEMVYNIEVHKTHTYFVGSTGGGAWVHNSCLGDELNRIAAQPGNGVEKVRALSDAVPDIPDVTFNWETPPGYNGNGFFAFGKPIPETMGQRPMLYIDEAGSVYEGLESHIINGEPNLQLMKQRPY